MALQARRVCVYDKARRARTQSQIRATLACGFALARVAQPLRRAQASAKPQPALRLRARPRGPHHCAAPSERESRKRVMPLRRSRRYDAGQRPRRAEISLVFRSGRAYPEEVQS